MNVDDWDGESPLPLLYSKTSTGAVNVWECSVKEDSVIVKWGQEDGKQQDAEFKCLPKNQGKKNETSANQQAVKEAIAKWKKQVKKKYHWSRDHVLTTKNLKPMLAKDFHKEEKKLSYPVMVQPKFDGVRCFAYLKEGRPYLQSRGGDPYVVEHIQKDLEGILTEGMILDGELYHHGTSLQTINSWVKKPQEKSVNIEYYIYDMYLESEPELDNFRRSMRRQELLKLPPKSIVCVPDDTAGSKKEVVSCHDRYVQCGYEGAIARNYKGIYKLGYRSSDLLKLKNFQDDEFEIIGWKNGKGKFKNVPIFACKTKEGGVFDCTPKGTEEERANMLAEADSYIGKDLTVRFFAYTDDNIPQFPVGIAIRDKGT